MRDSPLRALWVQSSIAIGLCFLILTAEIALVATDRRINEAISELTRQEEFDQRLQSRPDPATDARPRPALVVVLSFESLRPDRLDLYGYERETSPRLRELAETSVVFDLVGAQASHPLVSMKSMLTGKYPSSVMLEETSADLVVLSSLDAPREYLVRTFAEARGTLAAGLRAAGYRTAAFTDGGWVGAEAGFDRGFDVFEESTNGLGASLSRARDWLFENRGERLFLFVHSREIHCPYRVREPYESRFCTGHGAHSDRTSNCQGSADAENLQVLSDHYDGGVASADAYVGELVDVLRETGMFEEALLAVTADHGESLGERGEVGHGGLGLEEILVPLVLKLPASWSIGARRIPEPVELIDLTPTLLTSCGARTPEDLDGNSLLPIVLRGVRGRRYLAAQTTVDEPPDGSSDPAKRALLAPDLWYVIHDASREGVEFFPLGDDPKALVPLTDLEGLEVPPQLERLLERPVARVVD